MTRLTALVPEALLRRVECLAAIRNEHIDEVVRRALEAYVVDIIEKADGGHVQGNAPSNASDRARVPDWVELEAELECLQDRD